MIACPLLGTYTFLRYCLDRGIKIDRKRLIRLERLGLFAPVFRVLTPKKQTGPFIIPLRQGNNWFTKRWAFDTTAVPSNHEVPDHTDQTKEGYYSIFQIDHLDLVLTQLTAHMHLDPYLDRVEEDPIDWHTAGTRWLVIAKNAAASLRDHQYERTIALLCQHISNRYFPHTTTNMRTILIPSHVCFNHWVNIIAPDWDWRKEAHLWDPKMTEKFYCLTPKKLYNAYTSLAIRQADYDPIANWYQLTQFISIDERRNLKDAALRADTMRAGAHMLRLLYKDLYGKDLPHPNLAGRVPDNHVSELDKHQDVRHKLEFVANRFRVNPQPLLTLFVEGQSEEVFITRILEMYYGMHPGLLGIEIIVLHGIGTATGKKKADRYGAIFRLIDYLHHHQTITFLILDNESTADRLKERAKKEKSKHGIRHYATRLEYIRLWRKSLEFDNFSCTEIATALTQLTCGVAKFGIHEVKDAKCNPYPGSALSSLFEKKAKYGLNKTKLSKALVNIMMSPTARKKIENRAIIKILNRIEHLAVKNYLPTSQRIREANQTSTFFDRTF